MTPIYIKLFDRSYAWHCPYRFGAVFRDELDLSS